MSGLFITFEGTDGAGKSTQLKLLENYLTKKNYTVTVVREPGGTPIGEKIRHILADVNNIKMSSVTESLLYASARAQLVEEVIKPSLKRGEIVICDRYLDSSIVYQGYGRNLGKDNIFRINKFSVNGTYPDLTFFLDLPPDISISRKKKNVKLDRIESEKYYFHKAVYDGYVELCNAEPNRIKRIDANRPKKYIHNDVVGILERIINKSI